STSQNKTLTCNGGTVGLIANGANTYSWSNGALTNSVIATPTNVTSGPVFYTVTGTSTVTQCFTTKTISVNVFIPTLTVSGTTIACNGGDVNLHASGGNTGYNWQIPNGPSSSFANLTASVTGAAIFTVSAITNSLTISCPATQTVAVGVYPNPTITAVAQRT